MNWIRLYIITATLMIAACQSMSGRDTIAELHHQQIDIEEERIEGGLEKAMQGYQHFLQETPDTALVPEAIRRLADLKIEKEYGTLTDSAETRETPDPAESVERGPAGLAAPQMAALPSTASIGTAGTSSARPMAPVPFNIKADANFENLATQNQPLPATAANPAHLPEGADDLERAGPLEALALYKKLLNDYPLYDRNDQVLYQMSRACEELGRIDEAMAVMRRLISDYPRSRYIDEVQFRRAEYFFSHHRYLDAEEAYAMIVDIGVGTPYYELALYKLGWTFYKQELYGNALHRFIALLDYKVLVGYDFEQAEDEIERKRAADTFRVISLSFSNLGGADSVVDYFSRHGKRSYEERVYRNLGEFYFDKRRYADASAAYNAFASRNPFHKVSPNFHMRVIEIYAAGGFPSLVLDSKKAFATTYGLKADYWKYFEPNARQDVLDHLKINLIGLANHYHAGYQNPRKKEEKPAHFKEALHWYREFLDSFPTESESSVINYQLADLLLENRVFGEAAVEYEKTAYDYPSHEKASEAGYAAVYAHREHLVAIAPAGKDTVKRDVVRSSLKFVDNFPEHEKAAIVLGAAVADLYAMDEYEQALIAAGKLIKGYPDTEVDVLRTAWLITAHSSYELQYYAEAEGAYLKVLALLPEGDKTRDGLVDNLAASIYKQGELANAAQEYRVAADHFLRVGCMAPTSTIRANAEYDGAAALIELKDWDKAATVLVGFRDTFPGHALEPEVTKKIAYVYRENGQLSLAAGEYERIETESQDDEIRRDALLVAAELYVADDNRIRALEVYQRYVGYFPQPVDLNLEMRNKIAGILKAGDDREAYLKELRQIVAIDAAAGTARTPRTRYLAATSALVLAESSYDRFVAINLVKPFELNLRKKQNLMKTVIKEFNRLMDYELGEATAAATFYLAESYAHFSSALMNSERPVLTFDFHRVNPGETLSAIAKRYDSDVRRIARANNLNKLNFIVAGKKLKIPRGLYPLELEQYELAIEEQAYPFEEQAIHVHESNLKLISRGVYNVWIEKSLQKLAEFMPARYAKPEETSAIITSLDTYVFEIDRPATPTPLETAAGSPEASSMPAEAKPVDDEAADTADLEPVAPVPAVAPGVDVGGGAGTEVPVPSSDAASDAVLDSEKNKQEEQ